MSTPIGGFAAFALGPIGGLVAFASAAVVVLCLGSVVIQSIVNPLCAQLLQSGQSDCQAVFGTPEHPIALAIGASVLAGLILALPFILFQLARLLAPALMRSNPAGVVPLCLAGGILAILGSVFALFYEAPTAFAPVLMSLGDMMESGEVLGLTSNYVRAALVMAAGYAATLQVPVIMLLVIKSIRTRRAIQVEGPA